MTMWIMNTETKSVMYIQPFVQMLSTVATYLVILLQTAYSNTCNTPTNTNDTSI